MCPIWSLFPWIILTRPKWSKIWNMAARTGLSPHGSMPAKPNGECHEGKGHTQAIPRPNLPSSSPWATTCGLQGYAYSIGNFLLGPSKKKKSEDLWSAHASLEKECQRDPKGLWSSGTWRISMCFMRKMSSSKDGSSHLFHHLLGGANGSFWSWKNQCTLYTELTHLMTFAQGASTSLMQRLVDLEPSFWKDGRPRKTQPQMVKSRIVLSCF